MQMQSVNPFWLYPVILFNGIFSTMTWYEIKLACICIDLLSYQLLDNSL